MPNQKSLLAWPARHPARAGALGGWFQQGCGMLVALMLIPIATCFLTRDEAGIWFAFQGLVTMIGLLDLGFGFAISRQAAFTLGAGESTIAKGDFIHLAHGWQGVSQLFLLTRSLYRWLALAAAIAGLAAFEIFSRVGNLIPPETPGVRLCWYGMAGASVILILTAGQSAFVTGLGAVYQTRFLAGLYQLGAGAGAALAAWQGWGLPAMASSFALCALVQWLAVGCVRRRVAAPMRNIEPVNARPRSLAKLAKAALPVGGVIIFASLIYTIQPTVLGMLLGPDTVTPFYLAQKIALACNLLAMQAGLPQLPFFTRAWGAADFIASRNNMKKTLSRTLLLVILSTLGFYFLSPFVSSALLHHESYVGSATLLLMSVDLLLLGGTSIWGQYVLASGRNPFVISTVLTGLVSLGATVILVPRLGLTGLPVATIIAGLLFNYRKCLIEGSLLYKLLQKK